MRFTQLLVIMAVVGPMKMHLTTTKIIIKSGALKGAVWPIKMRTSLLS